MKEYLPTIKNIVALVVLACGLIWSGSEINTKATEGAVFASENHALPMRVCNLEKRADRAIGPINSIAVIQIEQKAFMKEMNNFKNDQKESMNDFKNEQREILKDFKVLQKEIIKALGAR